MSGVAAGMSDVGRCRQANQDQFLVDASIGLYAIADGMGGHAAGEVASDLAITVLAESMRQGDEPEGSDRPVAAGASRRDIEVVAPR